MVTYRRSIRHPLSPAQKSQPTDGQPLSYPNVAILEKIGIMRSNKFPRRELDGRLSRQVGKTDLGNMAASCSKPALALGFVSGTWFANPRQAPRETTDAAQSQQAPMGVAPGEHKKKH